MNYKQTILNIEDFINLESAAIEHHLENKECPLPETMRIDLFAKLDAYKDITDIIKEDKKGKK